MDFPEILLRHKKNLQSTYFLNHVHKLESLCIHAFSYSLRSQSSKNGSAFAWITLENFSYCNFSSLSLLRTCCLSNGTQNGENSMLLHILGMCIANRLNLTVLFFLSETKCSCFYPLHIQKKSEVEHGEIS